MRVAVLKNEEVLQTYIQLTSVEAVRLIETLQKAVDGETGGSYTERVLYENFIESTPKPVTNNGLLTFAILRD